MSKSMRVRRDKAKDIRTMTMVMQSQPWWDTRQIQQAWPGEMPSIEWVRQLANQLAESGHIKVKGKSRGRRLTLAKPKPEEIQAQPEPEETPIILALYSDRIEMPLSCGIEIIERMVR